ncbi:MAG: hypothetical protein ACRDFX_11115, partial [Chloroflexota bacterium]
LHRVININTSAAADVLRATGSFYSTDYHRMITAGNVANLADYYAHYTRNTGPLHTGSLDTQRKQFIGIVANHLFHELGALSLDQLVRLGDRLRIAVKHRDILVNLNASGPQSLVRQLGAAGAINPTTGDYLNVVDSNLSYNKINPYVHESISYRAHILPNRWLLSSVTLRYRNVPAPAYIYEDSFGPGAGKTGGPADYADFVRIYVPAGASLTSQSGWSQAWSPGPAYGKEMFSGYIIVRKGQTRTVTVRYLVPANVFSWSAGRRYRLVVQHQPGTSPDSLRIDVLGAHHRGVSRVMRHPYVDAVIGLRVPPVRLQVLQLPKSTPVVVAPGHEIEPHTVLALRRH